MADLRTNYSQYRRYFFDIVALYKGRQDFRAFLEILLSLGTIILFVAFAVRPTVITISQLLTELKNKEDTIAQMDTKIKNLQIAQSLITQNANQIAILETAIPDKPTPESMLRQVEGIAKKNNITVLGSGASNIAIIGNASPTKEDKSQIPLPEGAGSFAFLGTFSGDFPSLLNFLSDLENLRRPQILDSISLSTIQSQETRRIVLSVSARVPFFK